MRRKSTWVSLQGAGLGWLICTLVSGCGNFVESALPGNSLPTKDALPSFEALMKEVHQLPDGRLIIDQDILVENESAARAYYDRHIAAGHAGTADQLQQGLTVNQSGGVDTLWPDAQRMDLTYCVDVASFGTSGSQVLLAVEGATYAWSRRVGISFRQVSVRSCNNATVEVVFDIRQTPLGGAYAAAFFPGSARSSRELLVDPSALTTMAGGRDLQGILTHELGHVLGARHEHIWLTLACTSETSADARAITPYDVDSVMHYPQCRPSGTGGYRPTEKDYAGMHTLYGMSPALILTINS